MSLKPAKSILLSGIRNTLERPELTGLLERISEIVDDVHCPNTSSMTQMQLCNCVKPEVNAFLDAARNRFNQLSEDLQQQREAFEQPDQVPSAKLAHSKPYGWHISFKRAHLCAGQEDGGTGKRRKLAASASELYSRSVVNRLCSGQLLALLSQADQQILYFPCRLESRVLFCGMLAQHRASASRNLHIYFEVLQSFVFVWLRLQAQKSRCRLGSGSCMRTRPTFCA